MPQGLFYGCSSLESITLPFVGDKIHTSTDAYQYPLGYIFGISSYTGGVSTLQYYSSSSYTKYYIPSSLKEVTITGGNILDRAFYNCSNIQTINISNSVTSIGSNVFKGCSSLTSIVIPNSVTSIGSSAFSGCSNLTSITIPSSVTSIENWAFNYCSSLTKVYYKGTPSEWNNISITSTGNTLLTNATRYYYSETQPTEEGNYYHYDNNGNIVEW